MMSVCQKGVTHMNKRNFVIYGSYLAVLAVVAIAVKFFGLPAKAGLWTALAVAVGLAIFWPRW